MAGIDWSNIYKRYRGKWVALKQDEITVIASGTSPVDVHKKALKTGYKMPILAKMPSNLLPRIGGHIEVRLQNSARRLH